MYYVIVQRHRMYDSTQKIVGITTDERTAKLFWDEKRNEGAKDREELEMLNKKEYLTEKEQKRKSALMHQNFNWSQSYYEIHTYKKLDRVEVLLEDIIKDK